MKHEELDLERKCRQQARRYGWAAWKNEKNGNKGIPDSSFLHPDGRFLLVEFKKDAKHKTRPEQSTWLAMFPRSAVLVSSYADFCELLNIPQ